MLATIVWCAETNPVPHVVLNLFQHPICKVTAMPATVLWGTETSPAELNKYPVYPPILKIMVQTITVEAFPA